MKIACIAKAANGGRCRDDKVKNRRCELHQGVEEAPRPNDLLVKFELARDLTDQARELGLRFVERSEQRQVEVENTNRQEAEEGGVDFYKYRDRTGDSGTSVFNGKDGLRVATSQGFLDELMVAGFEIVDIHVLQRPKDQPQGKGFLLMNFKKREEIPQLLELKEEILDFIIQGFLRTWSRVTVFENPPRGDLVRHTVNHLGFASMAKPAYHLKFGDGHWEAIEFRFDEKVTIPTEYSTRA